MSEDAGFAERLRRIEGLVAEVEALADPAAQATLRELLKSVLELHERGLERILRVAGPELTSTLAQDELVSGLLLLHDLHPQDFETRVRRALDAVEPKLAAEGCAVTLSSLRDGVIRVRLERRTYGHHTTADALVRITEEALWELAPDAEGVEIDAAIEPGRPEPLQLVSLRVPAGTGSAA